MHFVLNAFIAFAGGFIYELASVMWVHYAEKRRAYATALVAMFVATAQVEGIGEAMHSNWIAPFFILGFGAGTFLGIKIKIWMKL